MTHEDMLFPSNNDDNCDYVDPNLKAQMHKRTFAGDNPMLVWMDEHDLFIQEFLQLEAPDCVLQDLMLPQCTDSTTIEPQTAVTFKVLKLFQLLMFGSKVSGFEFYQFLSCLTDNLGDPPTDHYNVFMWIVQQWCHICAMKCFGHGHDPSRVGSTCFAYFVEEKKYKEFLAATTDLVAKKPSTCSNYDAVKLANICGGNGVSASGVGAIECAHHDMKCPVSVGDLQLGEKYANMDYLYFLSIRNHSLATCVVSYDIVCQWTCKLGACVMAYPSSVVNPNFHQTGITYLIPKFHIYARRNECQYKYSFNFTPHAQEAIAMWAEHVTAFKEFSSSLPDDATTTFPKQIWAYESGQSTQNPYKPKLAAKSQVKVHLQLAEGHFPRR
ncbi:hypothetical protein BDN71DRAFT_1433874 [Pleurotus eryngii]|uniref:CxC2-like cysteine cluster KDZ transposase-associated domain-containing protein n=1 Tax=Pleurotus eryngii TaxID=5323 RepID=A0A9P6D575_PLEER|nr:hypothetical protein BDN71DRAFT_1433874 [Pleurotus eryngii]